jgi:hypothetical protein
MRVVACAVTAMLAGCSSLPAPPAQFTLTLAPTPVATDRAPASNLPLKIFDMRKADPLRIGEVYAPAAGKPPPVPAGTAAPAVAGAILLLPTAPTGRYLVVGNAGGVPAVIERAVVAALLRSGRAPQRDTLEASIRTFLIRPSWTTTCDIVVDLRLVDSLGTVRWQQTIESHVGRFEGWFTVEAFERVGRLGLDQFVHDAAAAFIELPFP